MFSFNLKILVLIKRIVIIFVLVLVTNIVLLCCADDVVALYLGIKMFIIECLYIHFPRLKHRHDSMYRIWRQLPTDAVLEYQYKRSLVDRVCFTLLRDILSECCLVTYVIIRDVTEFEFKCCQNATIFPHPNLSDMQRQFLVKFKFCFVLRNS